MPNETKTILTQLKEAHDEVARLNDVVARLKNELAEVQKERDEARQQALVANVTATSAAEVKPKTKAEWLREYNALRGAKAKAEFRKQHGRELGLTK